MVEHLSTSSMVKGLSQADVADTRKRNCRQIKFQILIPLNPLHPLLNSSAMKISKLAWAKHFSLLAVASFRFLVSGNSRVVEPSPHNPKTQGSSLAVAADTTKRNCQ